MKNNASSAGKTIPPITPDAIKASIATRTVKRLRCVNVEKGPPQDVYCLEATFGMVSVQGGIIASNCADAWRYFMIHQYKPYEGVEEKPFGTAQDLLDDLEKQRRRHKRGR